MTEMLTFRAAGELWAVPLSDVAEVVTISHVAHVPLTPRGVAGVFELHGATVTAIDFSILAGGRPAPRASAIVIGDSALLVDSIREVVKVDAVETASQWATWTDGTAGDAKVINPSRLLEALQ